MSKTDFKLSERTVELMIPFFMNQPTSTTVLSFLTFDPFSLSADPALSDLYTTSLHGRSNTSAGMLERDGKAHFRT